jgi:hypothetical protein
VLARVNETLSQNSKPLLSQRKRDRKASSQNQTGQQGADKNSGEDTSGEGQSESHLHLVQEDELPPPVPSVATAFLNLFGSIREKRTDLMRIFGSKNYQRSTTGLKKTTKFRKGTMLNEEAD